MKRTPSHLPTLGYYLALVRQTRTFGSCYLHAGLPPRPAHGDIQFVVTGYGRSLSTKRGHKYKAYAMRDGKPVRSKELAQLTHPETLLA